MGMAKAGTPGTSFGESPKSTTTSRRGRSSENGVSRGSSRRGQNAAAPLAHSMAQRLTLFLHASGPPEAKAAKAHKEESKSAEQNPQKRVQRTMSQGRSGFQKDLASDSGMHTLSQEPQLQSSQASQAVGETDAPSQSKASEAEGSLKAEGSEGCQAKAARTAPQKLMRTDLTLRPGGNAWRIDEEGEEREGTLPGASDYSEVEDLREELAGIQFEKSLIETRLREVLKAMERDLQIATMATEAVQKQTERDAADAARTIRSLRDENEALEDQMRGDVLLLTFKLDAVEEEKAEAEASFERKVRELTGTIEALQEENRELQLRRHEAGAEALREAFRDFSLLFEKRLQRHGALASRQTKALPPDAKGHGTKGGPGVKGQQEDVDAHTSLGSGIFMLDGGNSWSVRREEVEKEMGSLQAQLQTLDAERSALQLIV